MDTNLLLETQKNYALLTNTLIERNISITSMESCTSGLIASLITDTDNSSKVFSGSFVTYSNETKIAQGVSKDIIDKYGVYSKETSIEMAKACKRVLNADIAIGITGSLGIVDSKNKDSVFGHVYFTIDYTKPYSYFVIINNQGSKFLNKVYAANEVCKKLLELLGVNYD